MIIDIKKADQSHQIETVKNTYHGKYSLNTYYIPMKG
jgi:hypothetical protein